MPNTVPLYKLFEERGYTPSAGQMRAAGRILRSKHGYSCEHMYDPSKRQQRAHVDTYIVTKRVLDDVIRRLKVLDRAVDKPTRQVTLLDVLKHEADQHKPPEPLREAPVREQPTEPPKSANPIVAALEGLLSALRPDMGPIHTDMAQISFNMGMTLGVVEKHLKEFGERLNFLERAYLTPPVQQDDPRRMLPPLPSLEHLADYVERVAAVTPDKLVLYMELAEKVRQATKQTLATPAWSYDLPLDAVWQGKSWASLTYTDRFLEDWTKLQAEQQKAIRHMLILLTQNAYHRSLNTHRRKYKEANPPGTHDDAVYSRASDNVRVYWLKTGEDTVEFQRIIVKAG